MLATKVIGPELRSRARQTNKLGVSPINGHNFVRGIGYGMRYMIIVMGYCFVIVIGVLECVCVHSAQKCIRQSDTE